MKEIEKFKMDSLRMSANSCKSILAKLETLNSKKESIDAQKAEKLKEEVTKLTVRIDKMFAKKLDTLQREIDSCNTMCEGPNKVISSLFPEFNGATIQDIVKVETIDSSRRITYNPDYIKMKDETITKNDGSVSITKKYYYNEPETVDNTDLNPVISSSSSEVDNTTIKVPDVIEDIETKSDAMPESAGFAYAESTNEDSSYAGYNRGSQESTEETNFPEML